MVSFSTGSHTAANITSNERVEEGGWEVQQHVNVPNPKPRVVK